MLLSFVQVLAVTSFHPAFVRTAWSGLPEGIYLVLGSTKLDLNSDHPSIDSVSGGTFQLVFGGYKRPSVSGEMLLSGGLSFPTGPVPDPFYPEDSAEYGYIMFGVRYHLMDLFQKKVSPWIGLGWSWHAITWNTYFYNISGTSFTPYAGVDVMLGKTGGFLRLEVKRHSVGARSDSGRASFDIDVNEYNISLGYIVQ